jgi:hypothetical protein
LFGAEGTPTEAAILKSTKKSLLLKGEDASSRNTQQ